LAKTNREQTLAVHALFGKRNLRNLTVEDEKPTRFNRVGLLAHPCMLGPSGDSNGCVSFKTYDVFLRASQNE
jgi:hypothetical protein